jgi:Methane oxygenase PmoA
MTSGLQLRYGDTEITAWWGSLVLFRYVYLPDDPQLESPRPYFHPVRTLDGNLVTIYRPHDHVWHKGIALSLPHVDKENFWGGPTFRNGGYVQLPNDGAMIHESFDDITERDGVVRFDERLQWVTESGEKPVTERRRVAATAWPLDAAWLLAFETTLTNDSDADIVFGSPTTEGRPDAGYGGLFWRGPRSFTGGAVLTREGSGGDEVMGRRGGWLAFAGRHDDRGGASTLVFRDATRNFSYPTRWFVRSTPFAAVCPAPFYDKEYTLTAGASLTLRYDIIVADGEASTVRCAVLAAHATAVDLIT